MTLPQKRKKVGYKVDSTELSKEELLQIANEAIVRYQQKDFV